MPRVDWGVGRSTIDDFDREAQKQYEPYKGKAPPSNAVYKWRIVVAKARPGDEEKNASLTFLLQLVPRDREEKPFAGFKVWVNRYPTENNTGFWVPLLDALGVTSRDFLRNTITDEEDNIKRIGAWRNTGKFEILGELRDGQDQNGNSRKEINWFGAVDDRATGDDTDDGEDDGEAF